jgi:hypothetical protein
MTEAEWLGSGDLPVLMAVVDPSGRKLRLFAVACARHVWHLLDDELSRTAIELSEHSADHFVAYHDLDQASGEAERVFEDHLDLEEDDPRLSAAHMASYASSPDMTKGLALDVAEGVEVATALFRDILGNPFRPVTLDPAWLRWDNGAVMRLAQAIYEERSLPSGALDSARLAILADALEDAGCTDAAILDHCRGPGTHVRGCWALDLILGKK